MSSKRKLKIIILTAVLLLFLIVIGVIFMYGCQSASADLSGSTHDASVLNNSGVSPSAAAETPAVNEGITPVEKPTSDALPAGTSASNVQGAIAATPGVHSHTYLSHTVASTCIDKGYTEHICKKCGYSYISDYTDTSDHIYGEWNTTVEATCTAGGSRTRTCTVCGMKDIQDTGVKDHTYGSATILQNATCTETGLKTQKCSTCGKVLETVISAAGHKYNASSSDKGVRYVCAYCGDSYEVNFNGDHNFEHRIINGFDYMYCVDCDYKYLDFYSTFESKYTNQDKTSAMYTDTVKLKSRVYNGRLVKWPERWHEYNDYIYKGIKYYSANGGYDSYIYLDIEKYMEQYPELNTVDAFMKDFRAFLKDFSDFYGWTPVEPTLDREYLCLEYTYKTQYNTYVSQVRNLSSSKINSVVEDLVAYYVYKIGIYDGMQAYNAVGNIFDYLAYNKLTYDYTYSFHSAYYGLTCGAVVCDGYSSIFDLMCKYCGINSTTVIGTAFGEGHAWNAVTFSDGTVRYVDVTWYRADYYILIPEQYMRRDHNW